MVVEKIINNIIGDGDNDKLDKTLKKQFYMEYADENECKKD